MTLNEVKPLIYQFNSITHLYKGLSEADLKLEIYEYGRDALEVKLINKNYQKQCGFVKKHFSVLLTCSFAYLMGIFFKSFHLIYIDVLLAIWLIPLLWYFLNLVESEKLIYCYDFGLHLQIQKFFGKHNSFIAAFNIQDIVINEVVENFDFRYLLIVRTKGNLFNKNPIIPIFKIFKPSCDCLSLTYKHINKIMLKTSKNFI